jgi:hypothetical protein
MEGKKRAGRGQVEGCGAVVPTNNRAAALACAVPGAHAGWWALGRAATADAP